ncbi:MAG: FHA domain-containing protein [Anaerolineae bacterium]|nr:FHA domain-containing protein [Anaerolineae bacterium]
MSDMVSAGAPPLLAIEGHVTVYFTDGELLEGEYKAQDMFNIFLIVSNEPVMIPRAQIRYIKGKSPEKIVPDTRPSKERQITTESTPTPKAAEPALDEDDGTIILVSNENHISDNEDEGTIVLPPTPIVDIPPIEDDEDEEDGTLVLDFNDLQEELTADVVDDEGTFVLPPFDIPDDPDRTDIMPALPDEAEDDSDTTIVMPLNKEQLDVAAHLTCTSGPHNGELFSLKAGITTVGRSSDNVIVLSKDKEISRHHAILVHESGKFVVQDQNSLNGTFVNDQQITTPHYLKDGDSILVGLSTLKYDEH